MFSLGVIDQSASLSHETSSSIKEDILLYFSIRQSYFVDKENSESFSFKTAFNNIKNRFYIISSIQTRFGVIQLL